MDEKMITNATQPLSDADWKHNVDGLRMRWTSPAGDAGVLFDALHAQQRSQTMATWTIWAGPNPDRPAWAVTASPHAPNSLLGDLFETLAHGTGLRRPKAAGTGHRSCPTSSHPAVTVNAAVSRTR
ncbi:DUF317 domain-containing protein [Streptomyces sp. NPDC001665]